MFIVFAMFVKPMTFLSELVKTIPLHGTTKGTVIFETANKLVSD